MFNNLHVGEAVAEEQDIGSLCHLAPVRMVIDGSGLVLVELRATIVQG
jgi:hypothetical protein